MELYRKTDHNTGNGLTLAFTVVSEEQPVIQKMTFASAALVIALALAAPANAQPGARGQQVPVTSTDIQHLQDQVYDAGNELSRLRGRDPRLADQLQPQLDDLRDDVIYLRVKLRREGAVGRAEYNDIRSQIDSIRGQARTEPRQGQSTWTGTYPPSQQPPPPPQPRQEQLPPPPPPMPPPPPNEPPPNAIYGGTQDAPRPIAPPRRNEVPAGTQLDVRLERDLSSGTAQVEDRFTATTVVDLYQDNDVLIPAGSTFRGVVSSVNKATRTDRKGSLTVAFDQVTIHGRAYPIHATVEQAIESSGIRGEAGKIGAGAGVGAILGGILGGAKGAVLGVLIGGGGTIAATEGQDVTLPAGTVLRVKLDQPLLVK
jgi:hypothetical protein